MRKALPRASMKVRFTPIKEGVMEEKIDKVSTLLKEALEILKTQPSGATPRNTPQPTTDYFNLIKFCSQILLMNLDKI